MLFESRIQQYLLRKGKTEKAKEGTMPKLESQNVSYGFESVFSALLLILMCMH